MMNKIYCFLMIICLSSCYEDKGNYEYTNVNEVKADLRNLYGLKLKDTLVVLRPKLDQTLEKNGHNLRYYWLYSTESNKQMKDTISYADTVALQIWADDPDLSYEHYLRFNVYDETTGILYPYNTKIQIVKPYNGAWMVLHKQNGQTKLGAVEYIGNRVQVTNDAFYQETGQRLQGNPLCLGVHNYLQAEYYGDDYIYNGFAIITDIPDEAGVYCQWKKFRKMDSLSRMVAPVYRHEFDYQHVKHMEGDYYGQLCLTDGVLYQGCVGFKFYKTPQNPALSGGTYITHGASVGYVSIYYDKIGKRFLYFNPYNNYYSSDPDPTYFNEAYENKASVTLFPIPLRAGNVDKSIVDPNSIPEDQEVLFIGSGFQYGPGMTGANNRLNAYAFAKGADSCYVYEFRSYGMVNNSDASFSGYYPIATPAGVTEETSFASTLAYNGLLFYGAGDKIYRLDFIRKGGDASVIYQHPGGKARLVKFAKSGVLKTSYSDYGFYVNASLGVVFEMKDGSCDLVILNLSNTGKVSEDTGMWPAKQVYKGFGNIKDIAFL